MQRTRIQRGGVNLDISSSGKSIWVFRWRVTLPDGRRAMRKRVIGPLEQYHTKAAAENAARVFRMSLLDEGAPPCHPLPWETLLLIFVSMSWLTVENKVEPIQHVIGANQY